MAFGNNSNNENKKWEVNTKGTQFYSRGQMGATLILGYWKECLTLKISPMLPESKRSESKIYDYETYINTALTEDKLIELKLAMDDIVIPSIVSNNYNFVSVGVSSGNNFIEISNGSMLGLDEGHIVLTIYAGIDENGKCTDRMSYIFGKTSYFTGYDSEQGAIDKADPKQTEFIKFYNYIKQAIDALTHAHAHSMRVSNQWYNDMVKDSLNSLKSKLGIEGRTSNNNSGATFFNAGNNYGNIKEDVGEIENGGIITSNGGRLSI